MLGGKEAQQLKSQIFSADPTNARLAHYYVALIDFQAACREASKSQQPPEQTVKDLVAYIEKNGRQDKENVWQLDLLISQVYFDKNKLSEALKHAQAAFQNAPASVRPEITLIIKNIETLYRA